MKYVLPAVLVACLVPVAPAMAKSPKRAPHATVVKIMKESGQALVYDRNRGEYVLVRRGDTVAGYLVSDVDSDQIVLTTPTDPPMHYVLPLVPNAKITKKAKSKDEPASPSDVLDPYGGTATTEPNGVRDPYGAGDGTEPSTVLDPYSAKRPVTTVLAPKGSRVERTTNVPTVPAPNAPAPSPAKVRDPYATPSTNDLQDPYLSATPPEKNKKPAPKPATTTTDASDKDSESRKLSRKEFDDALSDFHARSKEVRLSMEKRGIRLDSIADGSFIARLGLRDKDLILSIAGHQIRNADEAAIVYVELSDARTFDIVLLRKGAKHTIHYTFTK